MPMTRYVAFLRAINVGGHTVKMAALRELFEVLDLEQVETFIASGNVIFSSTVSDAAALEQQIEAHLRQSLGYPVATFLRSTVELASIAAHSPFQAAEHAAGNTLYIAFLKNLLSETVQAKLLAAS